MKSDQELLRDYAERDDQKAFGSLVERHYGMVCRVARRASLEATSAEDVAMRVFSLLAEQAGTLTISSSLSAWLFGVARRQALNEIRRDRRKIKREKQYGEEMRQGNPNEAMSERELRELRGVFDEVLDELPEKQRQAVVLRYLEGHPQKEAAAIAGCPQGSLGGWAAEGLRKLRLGLSKRGVTLAVPALLVFMSLEARAASIVTIPENMISRFFQSRSFTQTSNGPKGAWKKMLTPKTLIIGTLAILLSALTVSLFFKQNSRGSIKNPPKAISKVRAQGDSKLKKRPKAPKTPMKSSRTDENLISEGENDSSGESDNEETLFTIFLESDEPIDSERVAIYRTLLESFKNDPSIKKMLAGNPEAYSKSEPIFRPDVGTKRFSKKILHDPPRILIKTYDLRYEVSALHRLLPFVVMRIHVKNYLPSITEIEMQNGKPKDIHLQFRRGLDFTGLVVDKKGKPLPGIQVRFRAQTRGGFICVDERARSIANPVATSSNDGFIKFQGLKYGKLCVDLRHRDDIALKENFHQIDFNENTESPYIFVYHKKLGASISLRCVDEEGNPIQKVDCVLSNRSCRIECKSDIDGYIQIPGLRPGEYKIQLGPQGIYGGMPFFNDIDKKFPYCGIKPLKVKIDHVEKVDLGDVVFESGGKIKGRIICENMEEISCVFAYCTMFIQNGSEVNHEKKRETLLRRIPSHWPTIIDYVMANRFPLGEASDIMTQKRARIDKNGKFEMSHMMNAPFQINAMRSNRKPAFLCTKLVWPSDMEQDLVFKPDPEFTLKGKVLNEFGIPFSQITLNTYRDGNIPNKSGSHESTVLKTKDGEFARQVLSVNIVLRAFLSDKFESTGDTQIIFVFKIPGYVDHVVNFNCQEVDENLVYDLGEIIMRKK